MGVLSLYDKVVISVAIITLCGVSILTFFSWERLRNCTPPATGSRIPLLLTIFTGLSWLYGWSTCILILTNPGNAISCEITIHGCALLYSATKVVTYLLLIERSFIIEASMSFKQLKQLPRLSSKMYIANMLCLIPATVCLGLMLLFNSHEVDSDTDICYVGLQKYSSWPLLAFDLIFSTFLVGQFIRPLVQSSHAGEKVVPPAGLQKRGSVSNTLGVSLPKDVEIRNLAIRTLIGSSLALGTSFANILHLALEPKVLATTCLLTCNVDVYLNCIVVSWMFSKGRRSKSGTSNREVVQIRKSVVANTYNATCTDNEMISSQQTCSVVPR